MLFKRQALGYLLASIGLIKFVTLGVALVAMIIGQAMANVPMALSEVVIFPLLTAVGVLMAFLLLKNLIEPAEAVSASSN
jgi:hypothetical protein